MVIIFNKGQTRPAGYPLIPTYGKLNKHGVIKYNVMFGKESIDKGVTPIRLFGLQDGISPTSDYASISYYYDHVEKVFVVSADYKVRGTKESHELIRVEKGVPVKLSIEITDNRYCFRVDKKEVLFEVVRVSKHKGVRLVLNPKSYCKTKESVVITTWKHS